MVNRREQITDQDLIDALALGDFLAVDDISDKTGTGKNLTKKVSESTGEKPK